VMHGDFMLKSNPLSLASNPGMVMLTKTGFCQSFLKQRTWNYEIQS